DAPASSADVDRQGERLTPTQIGPRRPAPKQHKKTAALSASCTAADFGSRTGDDLVTFVKASTTDCINSVLFGVTGTDAGNVFRESQMVTVADAFSSAAAGYPGDNSTSVQQLVLFLRAGYYVQFNHPDDVGEYGPALATAIEGGLDKFVESSHFMDVNDGNGAIVSEVITLTDSADEQHRYLSTYKRMLDAYDSSYDQYYYMVTAVNNVYTPLWRGHQNPEFVTAVTADPSIIDTLDAFAHKHLDLLGTENSFLDSNAGREMARFVQHPELQAKVRPLAKGMLSASEMTGKTAPLWVGVAEMANEFDKDNCADYGVCDLPEKLKDASLPTTHKCDDGHTFRVQSMTDADLAAACTSVVNQDAYFHNLVKDSGPVADDHNTNIEIDVWASKTDYATYSSVIFGNDTNNGGMYLEGDPADPANQARFVAYQKPEDDGFPARVWNLNHEYTHYLDGRYDMSGDFAAGQVVPDIWWVEGLAEFVSYSYRKVENTDAIQEAGKHTYDLSTLWQTTYENSDTTRIYAWGYLAVRYMVERHPDDIQNMLAKFRTGDYQGGYDYYNTTIGNRYDADFDDWLTACNTGACSGGTSSTPGH
ncbi:MAG TPA: collagenase, partial [Nocardioides sp.]